MAGISSSTIFLPSSSSWGVMLVLISLYNAMREWNHP